MGRNTVAEQVIWIDPGDSVVGSKPQATVRTGDGGCILALLRVARETVLNVEQVVTQLCQRVVVSIVHCIR